jgi:endonuclease/exonuclease/phosphatase family metal-dependent hydrolase
MRIVTLNAHQGLGSLRRRGLLAGIRRALRSSHADLVFLQEVGGDEAPAAARYEMLADEVWPQFAYGRNAVAGDGHQGNALLSKYPIARWRNVDVSVGRAEPRGLLHCELEIAVAGAARTLHAVCVHFGLREAHRALQVERLLAEIAAIPPDAPLVVAGDFNDWRGRAHRQLVRAGLHEICAAAGGRPARTFPAWCPLLRLDRIYVRGLDARPLALPRRPWAALSDHAPLAGEISWQAAPGG